MKKKKVITTIIIILLLFILALCLNVFIMQKFIKTYTYTELEHRGYTAQDISEIKIKHSYLNRILSYNEWRISVEFEKEPDILFWFTYRDNKIIFQGVSSEPMLDKESVLDYSERFKNGTLLENTKSNLSEISIEEPLDLEMSSGVGAEIAFESEDMLIFYGDFGLFGYDLKANEIEFSVDFVKAVGIEGSIQGSYGTDVDVSEDGNTIIISEYNVETETRGKTCYIDIPSMTYEHAEYQPLENPFNKENIKGSVYSGVKISQIKYMLNGKEWSLFE